MYEPTWQRWTIHSRSRKYVRLELVVRCLKEIDEGCHYQCVNYKSVNKMAFATTPGVFLLLLLLFQNVSQIV